MKVILNVVAAVCLAFLGFCIGLIYTAKEYGIPTEDAPIKIFVERYGLNLIGDSLAGGMALITLIVVMASLALQMQSAKQTVKEMKEQNAIAKAVAKATYKLSLFDKRSSVYQELNEVSMMVNSSGTFEHDAHARFVRAGLAAKNIFGDHKEIAEWVDRLLYLGRKIRPLHHGIQRYEGLQAAGTFGQREQDKLNEYHQRLAEKNMELVDAYDWDEMDRLFLPYLKLDTDIAIAEVTET